MKAIEAHTKSSAGSGSLPEKKRVHSEKGENVLGGNSLGLMENGSILVSYTDKCDWNPVLVQMMSLYVDRPLFIPTNVRVFNTLTVCEKSLSRFSVGYQREL